MEREEDQVLEADQVRPEHMLADGEVTEAEIAEQLADADED